MPKKFEVKKIARKVVKKSNISEKTVLLPGIQNKKRGPRTKKKLNPEEQPIDAKSIGLNEDFFMFGSSH
jgi:hypothetical protein